MASVNNLHLARLVKLRPAIAAILRDERQRGQDIDFRQRQRCLPDTPGFRRDGGAQLGKETALNLDDLFLRIENFGFVFFELRSGKPLGVYQCLLALVVAGRMVQVGFADLDVLTKNGIELYLERMDAGTLALALFNLRDVLLAVAAKIA